MGAHTKCQYVTISALGSMSSLSNTGKSLSPTSTGGGASHRSADEWCHADNVGRLVSLTTIFAERRVVVGIIAEIHQGICPYAKILLPDGGSINAISGQITSCCFLSDATGGVKGRRDREATPSLPVLGESLVTTSPAIGRAANDDYKSIYEVCAALQRHGINCQVVYREGSSVVTLVAESDISKFSSLFVREDRFLDVGRELRDRGISVVFKPAVSRGYLSVPAVFELTCATGLKGLLQHIGCAVPHHLSVDQELPLYSLISGATKSMSEEQRLRLWQSPLSKLLGVELDIDYPPQYKDGVWYKTCRVTEEKWTQVKKALARFGADARRLEGPWISIPGIGEIARTQ
jgi:hypothetical protein